MINSNNISELRQKRRQRKYENPSTTEKSDEEKGIQELN